MSHQSLNVDSPTSLYENWFNFLPGLAYRCANDKDWTMLFVSEGSAELTGFFPQEFTSQKISYDSLILPEYQQYVWNEIQSKLFEKKAFILEYKIRAKSGEIKWVWERGSGIFDDNGNLRFLEGFIADNTHQKELEMEISKSEYLMKTLLNAITESSLLIELDGTVVIANEITAQRIHKTSSELIGKNILNFLEEEVASHRKAMMNQVKRTKQPVVFEDIRFGRTILNSIYPVFDDSGEVFRFAIFGYDITDKKNIERKAEYSNSLFSAVFDSSSDAIFLVQPESHFIITTNTKARQLFEIPEGADLSTTPGYTFQKHQFTPDEIRKMNDALDEKGIWKDEIQYVSMKGHEFWGEIVLTVFNFHEEKYLLVRVTDISERKEKLSILESISTELHESNEQKDKFISILAHDLRGPFHPLLNSLELLDSEYDSLTEDEKKKFIKNSYETATNQFNLLESILNWSRASQNKMRVNLEQLRMYEVASTAIQQVLSISDEKRINIENCCDVNHEVIADYEMTLALFRNLLTNAIKFSDQGSRVVISTSQIDGMIDTSVIDNGLGITKERIGNMFNIISAKSTRGTLNEKGSGLGLLICKELVEKMGGAISIESEEQNGTKVSFSLPAAKS